MNNVKNILMTIVASFTVGYALPMATDPDLDLTREQIEALAKEKMAGEKKAIKTLLAGRSEANLLKKSLKKEIEAVEADLAALRMEDRMIARSPFTYSPVTSSPREGSSSASTSPASMRRSPSGTLHSLGFVELDGGESVASWLARQEENKLLRVAVAVVLVSGDGDTE